MEIRATLSKRRPCISLAHIRLQALYLQHGGGNYCRQNDVIVTTCIEQVPIGLPHYERRNYCQLRHQVAPPTDRIYNDVRCEI